MTARLVCSRVTWMPGCSVTTMLAQRLKLLPCCMAPLQHNCLIQCALGCSCRCLAVQTIECLVVLQCQLDAGAPALLDTRGRCLAALILASLLFIALMSVPSIVPIPWLFNLIGSLAPSNVGCLDASMAAWRILLAWVVLARMLART